jgi:hypothetical protein
MVSAALRNKGGMRFEDITQKVVFDQRAATGARMVDINNDGYLDIYVSVSGPNGRKRKRERTPSSTTERDVHRAGRPVRNADTSFTTHAVFLDYNRDGCIDLFE